MLFHLSIGVLEGRWTSEFPDAYKMPGDWESTVDILDAWNNKFDHNPVKYGQCWVFAAVQTSFLRAIGIATRCVRCSKYRGVHFIFGPVVISD